MSWLTWVGSDFYGTSSCPSTNKGRIKKVGKTPRFLHLLPPEKTLKMHSTGLDGEYRRLTTVQDKKKMPKCGMKKLYRTADTATSNNPRHLQTAEKRTTPNASWRCDNCIIYFFCHLFKNSKKLPFLHGKSLLWAA